ncbi:ubiquinone biosynthesis monooxygenase COQ6 [Phlyctochytrium arcticum]|nr:ubiquinone biosynthesis monooxygenase COQ6 [Phlyctochytrium arcticum]
MLRSISVGWRGSTLRTESSDPPSPYIFKFRIHTYDRSVKVSGTVSVRPNLITQAVVDHVCDVCIVGGGTVGTALACALGKETSHTGISLIEAGDLLRPANLEPNHFSNRFLKSVGVWDLIPLERKRPYTRMHVWDAHALVQRLQQFAGNGRITIHNRAKVRDITAEDGLHAESFSWPILELEEGKTIQTRLLVGADGGNSAGSTLNEEYSSLVWSTTPTLAKHLCSLPPATFVEILNAATTSTWPDVQFLIAQTMDPESTVDLKEERMWGLERNAKFGDGEQSGLLPPTVAGVAEGSRAPFPLKLRNAEEYVRSRVALIGDAAHTVHPLAGQGLNLGIADAQALANTIKSGLEVGQDIGHIHLLEKYMQARYVPNLAMMKGVDAIGRIFGTESHVLGEVRRLGMKAIDNIAPLKARIMDFASRSVV